MPTDFQCGICTISRKCMLIVPCNHMPWCESCTEEIMERDDDEDIEETERIHW